MSLRYRCLGLDHDDTVVDSTATIHHPCFQAFLDEVRPGRGSIWRRICWKISPAAFRRCARGRYGLTEAEMARELQFWDAYVAAHVPRAYSGMAAFWPATGQQGEALCRLPLALRQHPPGLPGKRPAGAGPDLRLGRTAGAAPSRMPIPCGRLCGSWRCRRRSFDGGRSAARLYDGQKLRRGICRGGWAYALAPIETFMRAHCDIYLPSVAALAQYVLPE